MSTVIKAANLPSYTGDSAACPKCGSAKVNVIYHQRAKITFACWDPYVDGAHLCRVCPACGYGWPEAPLDAKSTPAAADDRAARLLRMRCNQE